MRKKKEITTGQEFKNTLELIFKYRVNVKPNDNILVPVTRQQLKDTMPEKEARGLFEAIKISEEEIEKELNIIYYQPSADLSLHLFAHKV